LGTTSPAKLRTRTARRPARRAPWRLPSRPFRGAFRRVILNILQDRAPEWAGAERGLIAELDEAVLRRGVHVERHTPRCEESCVRDRSFVPSAADFATC
jgi:hypothetical protein